MYKDPAITIIIFSKTDNYDKSYCNILVIKYFILSSTII